MNYMGRVIRKENGHKVWPDVYVLMRIYFSPSEFSEAEKELRNDNEDRAKKIVSKCLDKLNISLNSVKANREQYEKRCKEGDSGRVIFLYNDDTPKLGNEKLYDTYKECLNNKLTKCFGEERFIETSKSGTEPGGMGSAYSTYLVRELFLSKAKDCDVAISLDQDDRLMDGAVLNIVKKMPQGGIVVSPFRIEDKEHLDITDDGGRLHNHIARRMSCKCLSLRIIKGKCPFKDLTLEKMYFPHGCSEMRGLYQSFKKNFLPCGKDNGIFWKRLGIKISNILIGKRNIAELSSIGWSKSYTKTALYQYHQDLKLFFYLRACENNKESENSETSLLQFLLDHRAYEDFIDFYMLLFEGIPISGIKQASHTYIKNPKSITSTPTVEDFRDHRTANLIALIDLCYAKKKELLRLPENREEYGINWKVPGVYQKLCDNFEIKLLHYIASKTSQIETILAKYIDDYEKKGENKYADFSAKTHKGFFINKLTRLALGENRGSKQDKELFRFESSRSATSKTNFEKLFSKENFNKIPQYGKLQENVSSKYVLIQASAQEGELRKKYLKTSPKEDKVEKLTSGNVTPHTIQMIYLIFLLIAHIFILGYFIFSASGRLGDCLKIVEKIVEKPELIAAIIALGGVILTILANELFKIIALCQEESSTAKLYYSEFYDLIRHIEANLKVMVQIRKEILERPKDLASFPSVQDIHFDNLRWPENSILFSDEMAKLISRDRVDDFARLKVNIRNINNSAKWLEEQAHFETDLLKPLEWEITRYFGYLANLYFLRDNNYRFPESDEIDKYLQEKSVLNRLTTLFISYGSSERLSMVNEFINKYFDDRRMKRSVLVK